MSNRPDWLQQAEQAVEEGILTAQELAVLRGDPLPNKRPPPMQHRHLDLEPGVYTLAAIDSVIERGGWGDWADLRDAALADPDLLARIEQLCIARAGDPWAQRHWFWLGWARGLRGGE